MSRKIPVPQPLSSAPDTTPPGFGTPLNQSMPNRPSKPNPKTSDFPRPGNGTFPKP